MTDKLLFTVGEVAEVLGISRSIVYRLMTQHEFPVIRIGKSVRVSRRVIEEWIETKKEYFLENKK